MRSEGDVGVSMVEVEGTQRSKYLPGEPMTSFGDLVNYVNAFTCSPHEI